MYKVSIVKYKKTSNSLQFAIDYCGGIDRISTNAKVFLKPNIVYWSKAASFPKWGVITTSQLVADTVKKLIEHGISDITIGEGISLAGGSSREITQHAFSTLGYTELAKRYGVKLINVFDRPFKKVKLGNNIYFFYNVDALSSDLIITLPVLKTHAQTIVSLGIKNLKGLLDLSSRKRCHSANVHYDLHFWIAHLANPLPPILTIIDGIYTSERGPAFDGIMHRSNLIIASWDVLSADLVGAQLLGHNPVNVPYLAYAATLAGRKLDLTDVEIVGLKVKKVARFHDWSFPYNKNGTLPEFMVKKGIKGIRYYKYDTSMCTYCSRLNGMLLRAISKAWDGTPWNNVEILTGKMMLPRPGANSTILVGKCMYQFHKNNPNIQQMFAIKGCPPSPKKLVKILHQNRIMVDPKIFLDIDQYPGLYMQRYQGNSEFDEDLFRIL